MSELQPRRPNSIRSNADRPTVHYVQEVYVRPINIMEEAARRPTRRTVEDTHPIFFIILKCLPWSFFLAAFVLAGWLAWEAVTGG